MEVVVTGIPVQGNVLTASIVDTNPSDVIGICIAFIDDTYETSPHWVRIDDPGIPPLT